jgi:hypothetical protein
VVCQDGLTFCAGQDVLCEKVTARARSAFPYQSGVVVEAFVPTSNYQARRLAQAPAHQFVARWRINTVQLNSTDVFRNHRIAGTYY